MSPLILIRHGHAEHLDGDLTGGWTDTQLTELGRRQSRALASRLGIELKGFVCSILCSDLRRAHETATIVGETLGVETIRARELREINNGIARGMTKEEAARHLSEPVPPLLDWRAYPGAETWREFYGRISSYMDSLDIGNNSLLIIVAHGGTIVQIINWWLRLDLETLAGIFYETAPASITVLKVNSLGDRTIERLNDAAHLYAEGLHDSGFALLF
jgi:broad specificity phosphatase PhoE